MVAWKMTAEEVATAINIPVSEWPGKCYGIAMAMVEAGLVEGTAVYGHWTGKVHPKAPVFGERSDLAFQSHGWILSDDEGAVVDPTRWVFENRAPYIYEGIPPDTFFPLCRTCSHLQEEHEDDGGLFNLCLACDCEDFVHPPPWPYDEGGNDLRAMMRRPPPEPKDSGLPAKFEVTGDLAAYCNALVPGERWYFGQLIWLGGLPYGDHGLLVGPLYQAMIDQGFSAAIPVDNRDRAIREHGVKRKT